jgi:hypothetical protein
MIQRHCDAMASMMIDHQGFRSIAAELRKQREIIEAGWPDVNFHIGANWHFTGIRPLGVARRSLRRVVLRARVCCA